MATMRSRTRIGRRRALAALGGALLVASGSVAVVRARGYVVEPSRAQSLKSLSAWQFCVVAAVARRIAAPDDAADASIPSADDVDIAGFVDGYASRMHPVLRRDLLRLLAFVEHVAPLGAGFASRFTKLGPTDQDRVLTSLESSDQGLLRGGFAALKSLVFMGYYRDPRTWRVLGYEGPWVNRPKGGFW